MIKLMKAFYPVTLVTLGLSALAYVLVPPPPPARAYAEQSTWAGTAGGANTNTLTVALSNAQSLSDLLGVPFRFIPAGDNTGPATIAVNGLTATAVRRQTSIGLQPLSSGELQGGVVTTVMYDGTYIEILSPTDPTPIGKTVQFRGSTAPRGTLIEDGSCVSQATYAALYSVIGTAYGSGCGGGQFALPDSRGAVFAALDNQGSQGAASRLTSAGSGCAATGLTPTICGGQNVTLAANQIPSLTLNAIPNVLTYTGSVFDQGSGASIPSYNTGSITPSYTNSSQQTVRTLQPTSLGLRAIKF
jgi:microcystin-dependent protein